MWVCLVLPAAHVGCDSFPTSTTTEKIPPSNECICDMNPRSIAVSRVLPKTKTSTLLRTGCPSHVWGGFVSACGACIICHFPPEHYFCCAQCNNVTLGRRPPIQPSAVEDRSLMWPYHIAGTPGCSTPQCSVPLTLHPG